MANFTKNSTPEDTIFGMNDPGIFGFYLTAGGAVAKLPLSIGYFIKNTSSYALNAL
ncbi:MAG: hypothetical protein Q8O30_05585 [Candidatus Omnitrophota bacterium]|nr:hypothetical protein [Candidatus Omnitrophota bacterium]